MGLAIILTKNQVILSRLTRDIFEKRINYLNGFKCCAYNFNGQQVGLIEFFY